MATIIQTSNIACPDTSLVSLMPFMVQVVRQSISNLVFSILLIIAGGLGFSPFAVHLLGIQNYFHPFWIGGLMIIASSLGIATYIHGRFRRDIAIAHLVFVVFAMLASIAGIVISAINVSLFAPAVQSNHIYIGGLCTNIASMIIYIVFFCTSIYQIVVYSRVSRAATNIQAPGPQGMVIVNQQQQYTYANQPGYPQAGYQPQPMQPPIYTQQVPQPIDQKSQGF